ncbi:MAG: hypothetical protein AAF125_12080, partial [Chloroflexota bacterium]
AALTVLPLWGLARRLDVSAPLTVLAWALVPITASFAGSWNTFYPLLAVLAFYGLHKGLSDGPLWLFLGGLAYGASTFLNFAPVPLALVLGFYTLIYYWTRERDTRGLVRPVIVGVWVAGSALMPWALWMLYGGASPLAILSASFEIHFELDRPYLPWVFLHTYDWALFAVLPLVVLSILRAFRPAQPGGAVALALWLSVIVLAVSGTARAETARVWSFFTPFVILGAVGALERWGGRERWALLASGAAMTFALGATWDVFDAIDMKPLPHVPAPLAVEHSVNAGFGDDFALAGWGASADDGEINLRLNWAVADRTTTPYWFSALWVGPDGTVATDATLWQGGDTNYPTTCWVPGRVVGEQVTIPLPEDAPSGDYWLSLAVFGDEAAPQDRLTVTTPDGTTDNQLGLGPVRVD